MRLQDSYGGQNTPFEGDQTLWLRSLPAGASVKHATMTLNPTLYSGTVDLTVPKPILGVTMVPNLSSPPANFVEVNFHARRTLVSATGSGGTATLQVDMGGIFVGIAPDGTIATSGHDFQVLFTSTSGTFPLPGLTVSKFRMSQSNVPLSIDSVDISSFPTNVNVRVGQLPPFWVQTGELATQITSSDFAKVLNALLATLQAQNGYYAIPFVIHSDTIACMDVSVDIEYIFDQAALPPHLSEINLPYTFNRLPDVDTSLSSPSQPSVNLPDGAAPVAGACSAQISGKFQPTRVALDRADDQVGTANVLISPMSSLAQQLSLEKDKDKVEDIAVTGIDLPLFNTSTDLAGLNVAIRDDDDGKPSRNVLVSTAVTIGKPLPDHSVWGSATLPKPFRITAGTKYWLVLQSQTGQAFWKATQVAGNSPGNPPLQASSDNGFSWQAAGSAEAIAPLAALFRLRSTPDRFSIPVQLKIGQDATAQMRSLDEFAPLGKVQFNFDFADTLTTYLTASTKASPSPCGTQDLVVNGDFANPPSDDAAIRLFGTQPNYIESTANYGFQSLPFPSQKVDLSVEHYITLTPYKVGQELVPPVKIDCAGAVPAQTTLDEIVAAINGKMAPYAQANHVRGDPIFTVLPQQSATEVLLYPPWSSTLAPTGWQNTAGQVIRFRPILEDGSTPIVVALAETSGTTATDQSSLSGPNDASTGSSPGGEISLAQRIPVAAGCAYQLGVRYQDDLSPDSNETGLASWALAWLDAQGSTLSSETGTFQAVSETPGLDNFDPSRAYYVDTLLVAPPKAFNADLTFSNAEPDMNILFLEQVSFVPTMQAVSNGEFLQFDATSGDPPAGWSLPSGTIGGDSSSSKPILQGSTTEDTILTQTATVVAGESYALRVLARPYITTQASDTQIPVIQQHARVELQWKGGASPGATISLALDGQNFMEADWSGAAPEGVTQALLRLIQPKSSDSASLPGLLVQSVALNRVSSAPVPLTFLSQTPGQLTVSNMQVGYDIPEAPLSAGQIVAAPSRGVTSGVEEEQVAQLSVLPPVGEGAMHAGVQASVVEDTNVRMLLKTLARESPTLRILRDNPQFIQQRFALSDVELNALKSADLLRAGELPAQAGEGETQAGGEQEVEGLAISGTGTIVPPTYIPGLDVSHHNGLIDWAAVAGQKYVFAFAKATEGTGFTDGQFAHNWAGMKANSILRGAYHFFRANLDATRQANHFLKVMPAPQAGDLPPVLDLETTDGMSGTAILDAAATWLALVEKASGRTPIIYTSARFWQENLAKAKDPNRFGGHYPVWVAYYRHVPQPPLPVGWTSWTFWQYTDSGKVAGIPVKDGKADLDRFYGTLAQLRNLAGF
jgi:GH25 family lysozyme M1 (1,4-beta-N-acetylmuramidase)